MMLQCRETHLCLKNTHTQHTHTHTPSHETVALCDDGQNYGGKGKGGKNRSKSRSMKGPCPGGFWPDGHGCCPKRIGKQFFYRDFQGCYPDSRGFYADGKGCFPNSKGVYRSAGSKCSKSDQCHPACIRPKKSQSKSQHHSKSNSKSNSNKKSRSKSNNKW